MDESAEFDAALRVFLQVHGHRGPGRDPSEPRWHEQPAAVAAVARAMRERPDPDTALARAAAARERAEAEALGLLDAARRRALRWALRWARVYARYREDARHDLDRLAGAVRIHALDCGAHAAQCGRLGEAQDVFMLTPDELWRALAGAERSEPGGWPALVGVRRAVHYQAHDAIPPAWLDEDAAS
jgi:hypothetical protein